MHMIRIFCISLIVCLGFQSATAAPTGKAADSLRKFLEEAGGKVHRKDYPAAIEKFNKALTIDPNNVMALRTMGTIYVELKDPKTAIDYFNRAYKIDPNDAALNNNLGAMASNEGKSAEAIQHFQIAVKFDSSSINFKLNLALEYAKAGQNGNAMPLLRQIERVSPGIPVAMYTLGNCFASLGSFDSAEVYFDKSVASGEKVDDLFFHRAAVKKKLGKLVEAEKDYATALEINPNNVQCRQALGMFYIGQRRYSDATKQFEALVKIDSSYVNGLIGLGASYSLGGRVPDGDKVLERLFAKDSAAGFQMLRFIGEESNKIRQEQQKK